MHISMKCSVAVHCLIFMNEAGGDDRVTSTLLAESTGCNPASIRALFAALKKSRHHRRPTRKRRRTPDPRPQGCDVARHPERRRTRRIGHHDRHPPIQGTGMPRGTKHPRHARPLLQEDRTRHSRGHALHHAGGHHRRLPRPTQRQTHATSMTPQTQGIHRQTRAKSHERNQRTTLPRGTQRPAPQNTRLQETKREDTRTHQRRMIRSHHSKDHHSRWQSLRCCTSKSRG